MKESNSILWPAIVVTDIFTPCEPIFFDLVAAAPDWPDVASEDLDDTLPSSPEAASLATRANEALAAWMKDNPPS